MRSSSKIRVARRPRGRPWSRAIAAALLSMTASLLLAWQAEASPPVRVDTQVNEMYIYGSTFGLFEEPDPDIPETVYDLAGNPYHGLELTEPIAEYSYESIPGGNGRYIRGISVSSKPMPYLFNPDPSRAPVVLPQFVHDALRSHLPGVSDEDFAANTRAVTVATGHFEEPSPGDITGEQHNRHFQIHRVVDFTVNIQFMLVYEPPDWGPATAVILPFATNAQIAARFGVPPTPGIENEPVSYTWRSTMDLDDQNDYISPIASEPLPLAIQWPYYIGDTLELRGQKTETDWGGNYSIVGVAPATFTSSQYGILTAVFGSETPQVTMVIQQIGVLTKTPL